MKRIPIHLINTLASLIGEAPPEYRGRALLLFVGAVSASVLILATAWSMSLRR